MKSTRFLIHTTIFLKKTSPPLPAGVRMDVTVVTQTSYFHMYTEVPKESVRYFPPMQSHGGQIISHYASSAKCGGLPLRVRLVRL